MEKSIILTIFRLITPDDLSGLTETQKRRALNAADSAAELVVWDDQPAIQPAKVLPFSKQSSATVEPTTLSQIGVLSAKEQKAKRNAEEAESDKEKPSESDFLLEEREKFKESEDRIFKQNGFACYQRSSDLGIYRVTVTDDKGKEKSRLTSSQGVLINRKQA